jgi:prepilin-type N-terminal cleavage/methylation domain-containing protein
MHGIRPRVKGICGFTLIELLVTVTILGILSAIAIPLYTGYQRGAARQEATANLQGLSICLEQYFAENGRYNPAADGALPITYNWQMNDAGAVTTPTSPAGLTSITTWLPCFQPQKSSGGTINKYNYSVTVGLANTYVATASGARKPVSSDIGANAFSIDNTGFKNGPWPH